MEASMKNTDDQKQLGSEKSQGAEEMEANMKNTDAQLQLGSERAQGGTIFLLLSFLYV